jgi:hypothetical protein
MDGLAEGSEAVWSSVDAQRHAPQFALTAAVGLASAKTFLISAACLRKIGAISSLPLG